MRSGIAAAFAAGTSAAGASLCFERQLKGQTATPDVAEAAGELAILGARPLQHNAYKIPLMRNLVRRAIRGEA